MTEEMNTLEVLMKARALLSDPDNWAADITELGDFNSRRHCMLTALGAIGGRELGRLRQSPAYKALRNVTGTTTVAHFNDTHGHSEVLAAFDRAIEAEWEKVQGAAEPVVREAVPA